TLEEVERCLVMTDDRNLTSHTYIEEIAEALYWKLPDYVQVMHVLLKNLQD
ncbi:MAG TPA: nucleotidyltransferase substrate binding protein, partial [Anaerolineae bacterium]|nr:nucleotidyltransferase substrate binding protein [Anaerolineae bacterium]